ncbi:MAG: aminotransferase class I/II-fold pyridoxal phosphate-dependent enzyme [Eggerthellaceae bacterium]|nr:aminotransferase class I/II-fold pyridoxal phosphate-dependent enzyme [Eggerthellaceae bacterium]
MNTVRNEFENYKKLCLNLDMSRGKPCPTQLKFAAPMHSILQSEEDFLCDDGIDARTYGDLGGFPEAKKLMGELVKEDCENVIVCGNSSLNLMYDSVARYMYFGARGSKPWCLNKCVKWICPVPGYDRHFSVTQEFGIEMIPVPMENNDLNYVKIAEIAASSSQVKGIWLIPQYSNPTGIVYSDKAVKAIASMETAADSFRIFWDNAYCVHHLEFNNIHEVYDIGEACRAAGHPDRYLKFASTSKITFPGAGISCVAGSKSNIDQIMQWMSKQTIGYDKLNMKRHVKFLKNKKNILELMKKHASIIKPKFDIVLNKFEKNFSGTDLCSWIVPEGGYFVLFRAKNGHASRIVELCNEAGVVLTGAGATWPYGEDPNDSEIRIAPTYPSDNELQKAMDIFCCCVKLAAEES